jgi:hypothetical protein
MTAASQTVQARLSGLREPLAIIAEHAQRYAHRGTAAELGSTIAIGHQPWRAPEAYAFRLFAPAEAPWLSRFEERHAIRIPKGYREVLLALNGCWAYGLALYGLPPSMQAKPPLLDRRRVQPLDLGAANTFRRLEYSGESSAFHFGSRAWSATEKVGYFWGSDGLRSAELPKAEALMLERAPKDWCG